MSIYCRTTYALTCDTCRCPFFGSPPGELVPLQLVQQAIRRGWDAQPNGTSILPPVITCPRCRPAPASEEQEGGDG